jgi:phage terminase large subunit-like protein
MHEAVSLSERCHTRHCHGGSDETMSSERGLSVRAIENHAKNVYAAERKTKEHNIHHTGTQLRRGKVVRSAAVSAIAREGRVPVPTLRPSWTAETEALCWQQSLEYYS